MRHLGQSTFEFTDITSRVISGTVSHDAFGAAYFTDCPHTKSSGECICPVDGAEVYVKRASGEEETVELNDGKFAQSVFEGETVTIGLRKYNGTNGDLSHSFLVTHDADNATVQNGICRDKSNVCGGGEPDCEPSDGTCSRRSADHASSPTPVQTFHLSSRMCNVS